MRQQQRTNLAAVFLFCTLVVLVLSYYNFSNKLTQLPGTKPLRHDATTNMRQNIVGQYQNMQMPRSLIMVADSHGLGLQQVFRRHLPHWTITVSSYPTGTVQNISSEVVNLQKRLKQNVSYVILHAGTNNFYPLTGSTNSSKLPFQPRDSEAVIISSIISALEALRVNYPGAAIIYSANLPRGDIPEYTPRQVMVNKEVQTKVAPVPSLHFVDHTRLFQTSSGQLNNTLYKDDHKHLNKAGQDLLVRNLIRAMSHAGVKGVPKAWFHDLVLWPKTK